MVRGCVVDSDPQGSSPCSIVYFLVTLCLTFLTYKMGTTRESISQAPPEQYNLCFLTSTASLGSQHLLAQMIKPVSDRKPSVHH